jgi:hypothetical protein
VFRALCRNSSGSDNAVIADLLELEEVGLLPRSMERKDTKRMERKSSEL